MDDETLTACEARVTAALALPLDAPERVRLTRAAKLLARDDMRRRKASKRIRVPPPSLHERLAAESANAGRPMVESRPVRVVPDPIGWPYLVLFVGVLLAVFAQCIPDS